MGRKGGSGGEKEKKEAWSLISFPSQKRRKGKGGPVNWRGKGRMTTQWIYSLSSSHSGKEGGKGNTFSTIIR